jgi:hypothetical protein
MMIARLTGTLAFALILHLAAGSSRGQSFDEQSLKHDAENLLAADASRRIFSTAELANLQSILKLKRTEGIDRLAASKAAIEVTINPEARVSAGQTGARLPSFTCGIEEPLLIRIVNSGHVSSVLNAHLLGESTPGKVSLGPISPHLSGASVEYRLLMLTLNSLQPLDLSIAIDAGPGTDDLSLRSQFSLLLRCSSPKGATVLGAWFIRTDKTTA